MNNDFDAFAQQHMQQQHINNNNNGNRYQGVGGGGGGARRQPAGGRGGPIRLPPPTSPKRKVSYESPAASATAAASSSSPSTTTTEDPVVVRPLSFLASWSPLGAKSGASITHITTLCILGKVAYVQLGVGPNSSRYPSSSSSPLISSVLLRLAVPPPLSGALSVLQGGPHLTIEDMSMVVVYIVLVWRCFGAQERRWGSSRFWAYLLGLHIVSLLAAGANSLLTGLPLAPSLSGALWAVPLMGVVASGVRAAFPNLFSLFQRRRSSSTGGGAAVQTPLFTPHRLRQMVPAAAALVLIGFTLPVVPAALFTAAAIAAAQWLSPNSATILSLQRRKDSTSTPRSASSSSSTLATIQRALYLRLAQRTLAPLLRRVLHNLPTPATSRNYAPLPTTPVRTSIVTCIQELGYNSQGTALTEEEEMLYAAQRSGLAVMRPAGVGGAQQQQQQHGAPLHRGVGDVPAALQNGAPHRRDQSPPSRHNSPPSQQQEVAVDESTPPLTPGQQSAINSVLAVLPHAATTSAKTALIVNGWSVDAAVMFLLDNPEGI